MFLAELYNENYNLQYIYDLVGREMPTDIRLARLGAVEITFQYKLLNSIERELLKAKGHEFKAAAKIHFSLYEIMDSILNQDEMFAMKKDLSRYAKKLNKENNAIYLSKAALIIDDYYEIKKLGEGSFGVVYLALDGKTGNKVVVKKIKRVLGTEMEEYKSLIDLKSECSKYFTCVLDFIEQTDYFFIIMEYNQGYVTLADSVSEINKAFKDNITSDLVIVDKIIYNLCQAVKYMHGKAIAHNDIKPDNIMVNLETGNIKFIDFGLSCHNRECEINIGGNAGGTLPYFDPYQYNHAGRAYISSIDRAAGDIWSVGITIYVLVLGRPPMYSYSNMADYFESYTYARDPNRDKINAYLALLPHRPNLDVILNKRIL